ncbi:ThiJ/PfpI domain-containing protein [Planoprotostelium fungivorum]|uniref:ThiJ/PfpI domain-containing protein n=1 Tax=Planoprotostelium fungivorum TaxID=1890364 RepID=A0A2P6NSL8_9EUKA|nr:ThiJ/PfpI domain-containing protein [Planoprotostelium fungivorum]PRP86983.1 ThiJ/PfpI domain-containing protein [Planoprotostelium fungivorum]
MTRMENFVLEMGDEGNPCSVEMFIHIDDPELTSERVIPFLNKMVEACPKLRGIVEKDKGFFGNNHFHLTPDFDIRNHVHNIRLGDDTRAGTQDELNALAAKLYAQSWVPDRPMWSVTVVQNVDAIAEDGNRESVLIFLGQHSLGDGISWMLITQMAINSLQTGEPPRLPDEVVEMEKLRSAWLIFLAVLKLILCIPIAVIPWLYSFAQAKSTKLIYNDHTPRTIARSKSIKLSDVEKVRKIFSKSKEGRGKKATVNDVAVATFVKAWNKVVDSEPESVRKMESTYVGIVIPISMRPYTGGNLGNWSAGGAVYFSRKNRDGLDHTCMQLIEQVRSVIQNHIKNSIVHLVNWAIIDVLNHRFTIPPLRRDQPCFFGTCCGVLTNIKGPSKPIALPLGRQVHVTSLEVLPNQLGKGCLSMGLSTYDGEMRIMVCSGKRPEEREEEYVPKRLCTAFNEAFLEILAEGSRSVSKSRKLRPTDILSNLALDAVEHTAQDSNFRTTPEAPWHQLHLTISTHNNHRHATTPTMKTTLFLFSLLALTSAQYAQQNGIKKPTTNQIVPLGSTFDLTVQQFGSMAVGGYAINVTITNVQTKQSHFYGQFRNPNGYGAGNPITVTLVAPGSSFGAGPANITVNDIVGTLYNNGTAVVDPYVQPVYSVIVQLTSGSNTPAASISTSNPAPSSSSPSTKSCGANQAMCNDARIGQVCFDQTNYHCVNDPSGGKALCHKPDESCGKYCYDINLYTCKNGKLQQKHLSRETDNRTLRALMPLPDKDFDTTETSVPWAYLSQRFPNLKWDFATENGAVAACDQLLLTGVIFGQLGATPEAKEKYSQMISSEAYQHPIRYSDIDTDAYDLVLLPGGHAKGMRQIIENLTLREKLLPLFHGCRGDAPKRVVGAICHGVVTLCRVIDPNTKHSVLYDLKTTSLPKHMEKMAYYISAWKLGDYYRTYPEYVEDEVKRMLRSPDQFIVGRNYMLPGGAEAVKNINVVEDGNYISARWPGDAERFSQVLGDRLDELLKKR